MFGFLMKFRGAVPAIWGGTKNSVQGKCLILLGIARKKFVLVLFCKTGKKEQNLPGRSCAK